MGNETTVREYLLKAYHSLKTSDLETAVLFLEEALQIDFENSEVMYSLKCVNWWTEKKRTILTLKGSYERGDTILNNWKPFLIFLDRIGDRFEDCVYAIKHYVFSTALFFFKSLFAESTDNPDHELLLRVGHCYKRLGNYDKALKYLEEASRQKKEDAVILAELADIYALINEPRAAKALFREAFFINPQKIEVETLESELILRLYESVEQLGFKQPEIEEWVPVFGVLFNVLSVKRELRAIELGKLKQSIFNLENELREKTNTNQVLIPRLINRYFWLIDHYVNVGEEKNKIDETLLRIKVLNPEIYKKYIGS